MIDKLEHFLICFLLVILLSLFFGGYKAIGITLFLAIVKEIIDGVWLNGFSIADLIADILGIYFAILMFT